MTRTLLHTLLLSVSLIAALLLAGGCDRGPSEEVHLPLGKTAQVSFVAGEVLLRTSGENGWRQAAVGDLITQGTVVRTGADSYCELVLSSGTIFRMKDRSELQVSLLPEDEEDDLLRVRLVNGRLLSRAQKISYRSRDVVETDTAVVSVRGTGYLVRAGEAGTTVMVHRGSVRVRMNLDPEGRSLPRQLNPVLRRVRRGVKVRRGFKVEVPATSVRTVRQGIRRAERRDTLDPRLVGLLREQAYLASVPQREHDREELRELDTLLLAYQRGNTYHLSPNFDGVEDEFVFSTGAFAGRRIESWQMQFKDGSGHVRRVIRNRIPGPDESVVLPHHLRWNLVSNDGAVVPDGDYVYELFLDGGLVLRGVIVVDTRPPVLEVEPEGKSFSPNGDGVKDELGFLISAAEGNTWTCTISTVEGYIVKTLEWSPFPPERFVWDGTGENGAVLPEGMYDLRFSGRDRAGNLAYTTVRGIALDLRERQARVEVDNPIFSPNGDGMLDTVTFTPVLSDHSRMDKWDLIVQTEKGETAKRFRGWRWMPRSFTWDGQPEGKAAEVYPEGLPSGRYNYFMQVTYSSGINTYSFRRELILDVAPPDIQVSLSPQLFSPDGDGVDDTLSIQCRISDLSPVRSWKAAIYDEEGAVFKTFQGSGRPASAITWDGVSDTGVLVDSGEDYTLVVEVTDHAYNTGTSEPVPFSIDILVIPTERGLKIRASTVQFGFNTAELEGEKTFTVLDKIVQVLRKYGKYAIIVEGHTDATGDDEYNRYLSEKRAERVADYLAEQGIQPDRLTCRGMGEAYPVDSNQTRDGRRRNRRVEFILIRE
jgi:outer membrane protein OmpA-like peptidoglycan-associated protein